MNLANKKTWLSSAHFHSYVLSGGFTTLKLYEKCKISSKHSTTPIALSFLSIKPRIYSRA
jgi:hypothetical protein